MKVWNLEVTDNCVQTEEYDSFIGGKPKLPPDIEIPKCDLCGKELFFMFQVAFPEGHEWEGKSMAVFYCIETWHDSYCIPQLSDDMKNISQQFLEEYERNFRILVFDTSCGKIVDTYKEKVSFQPLKPVLEDKTKAQWDFVIGGRPIWIMGMSEKPDTIADVKKPKLLLQVREDFQFNTLPDSPRQANPFSPDKLSRFPWYELFASDRIYFWGVQKEGKQLVYTSVQSE